MDEWMPKGNVTHLYDPCRCFLLTPHYPLCADDARRWVDCPVECIDADDVCAFRVGVFVPHPNNHMRPWVARQRHKSQPAGILCKTKRLTRICTIGKRYA